MSVEREETESLLGNIPTHGGGFKYPEAPCDRTVVTPLLDFLQVPRSQADSAESGSQQVRMCIFNFSALSCLFFVDWAFDS